MEVLHLSSESEKNLCMKNSEEEWLVCIGRHESFNILLIGTWIECAKSLYLSYHGCYWTLLFTTQDKIWIPRNVCMLLNYLCFFSNALLGNYHYFSFFFFLIYSHEHDSKFGGIRIYLFSFFWWTPKDLSREGGKESNQQLILIIM